MRQTLTPIVAFLSALLMMSQVTLAGEGSQTVWVGSYEQALKLAETSKQPILLHFYADWCMPCQRMEREVLNDQGVIKGLNGKLITVKIDSQARQDLVQKFGVQLLPSDVFVDPQGRVLASVTGFRDTKDYVALGTRIESRYAESQRVRHSRNIAKNQSKKPVETQKVMKVSREKPAVIALDGYSPVALREDRKWVTGKSSIAADFKEQRFNFSSEEERDLFLENPTKYAPRLLGCDPVTMWETDRAIAGLTEFGAFFNGDLFLFTNAENRQLFKIDPSRYTRTQHVLRADDIETGTVIK